MNTKSSNIRWLIEAVKSPDTQCLLWPFKSKDKNGYGKCLFEGHFVASHRLAFFLYYGHWPQPCGRHTCDNPACVNPTHVVAGTHLENMADRTARKRTSSRLSERDVLFIRSEYRTGEGFFGLARKFHTSHQNIHSIISRRTWRHIP